MADTAARCRYDVSDIIPTLSPEHFLEESNHGGEFKGLGVPQDLNDADYAPEQTVS